MSELKYIYHYRAVRDVRGELLRLRRRDPVKYVKLCNIADRGIAREKKSAADCNLVIDSVPTQQGDNVVKQQPFKFILCLLAVISTVTSSGYFVTSMLALNGHQINSEFGFLSSILRCIFLVLVASSVFYAIPRIQDGDSK